jgi:hypothetical protein
LNVLPNQAGMPWHPLLGLVKHSRTTDSWLWLLVILVGLAEYSAISMEGV